MKPKFKLIAALKIWLVIYPSITLFLLAFGNQLSGLALYQRTFILTITLVPWMVFIGVPVVDSIFKMISSKKEHRTQRPASVTTTTAGISKSNTLYL